MAVMTVRKIPLVLQMTLYDRLAVVLVVTAMFLVPSRTRRPLDSPSKPVVVVATLSSG